MPDDPVGLIEGIASTRAIRRYRDEPVPTDALAAMMFAATRAPSGSNRQPFRFLVLRDGPKAREAKRLIGESARSIWGGKRTADGYDRGSGREANTPKARMARTMQHYVTTSRTRRCSSSRASSAIANRCRPRARRSTPRARTCCSRRARSATAG